ncbi:hypothetical protein [Arthrobacter sp.]|uniref:hypothetical protein n=1 Tax=Arthrobacter sp. TaxID=1667 RepID=UPI00339314DB
MPKHQTMASAGQTTGPSPRPTDLARMDEVIAWVSTHGRLLQERSADRSERSMARWLYLRRREAAGGTLDPTDSEGLPRVPGCLENLGQARDDARWHEQLARLEAYREDGNEWPRHQDTELEHALGVCINTPPYRRRHTDAKFSGQGDVSQALTPADTDSAADRREHRRHMR